MIYQLLPQGVLHIATNEAIKHDLSDPRWQAYRAWLKAANTPLPADPPAPVLPTVASIIAAVTLATQARLDAFARTRSYDGILSACTYATSTVAQFATEGQHAVTSRDATWAALYQIMAEVQAGIRPMPTGFADIEPLLPVLTW